MAPSAALEQASKLGMDLLDNGGRQLFGISREADWVVGGAAFGFAAGIIQLLANRALEVDEWVHHEFCVYVIFQMGDRSSESASQKDKSQVDYDYKWPGKKRMDRRDFAQSDDVTYHGDDSVYDYQDYYENNLNHEYNRYSDFLCPINVEKEEDLPREEKVEKKKKN